MSLHCSAVEGQPIRLQQDMLGAAVVRHACRMAVLPALPAFIALQGRRILWQTTMGPTLQEVGELDGICTYCEMAVPLVSRLAERFGLPGNRCAQPGDPRQPRLFTLALWLL